MTQQLVTTVPGHIAQRYLVTIKTDVLNRTHAIQEGVKVKPTRASRRFHQQVASRLRNVLVMELVEKL